MHRALGGTDERRAAAIAAVLGCGHPARAHRRRAALARRLLLALPALDDDVALVVAVLLTAPLHDELVAAAGSGRLRRHQGAVLAELVDRWTPALVALELALVTADGDA